VVGSMAAVWWGRWQRCGGVDGSGVVGSMAAVWGLGLSSRRIVQEKSLSRGIV
jgi:hypothetical protein